jgi:hypothetical protein
MRLASVCVSFSVVDMKVAAAAVGRIVLDQGNSYKCEARKQNKNKWKQKLFFRGFEASK